MGDLKSGIMAHIRGWNLGIGVRMFVNEKGHDELVVYTTGGSNNPGQVDIIFTDATGKEHLIKMDSEFRIRIADPYDLSVRLNMDN